MVSKGNKALGFIRRNVGSCPEEVKKQAYLAFVRPHLEYASSAWEKKDNHWSTKHYTENYHFPHSDIFFHRKQKSDFYFLDSNFPSNFYHKFLAENCRAGLMIFLHLSCQFILLLGEMIVFCVVFCRSVIVLFLLAIVLPALALGDLKTLLALFLKQKRVQCKIACTWFFFYFIWCLMT
jgi:hypothetical protein